jgi:hypothetical protein
MPNNITTFPKSSALQVAALADATVFMAETSINCDLDDGAIYVDNQRFRPKIASINIVWAESGGVKKRTAPLHDVGELKILR